MRIGPEFEPTQAQLLHASSVYSLDKAFAFVCGEETRLQVSFLGGVVLLLFLYILQSQ